MKIKLSELRKIVEQEIDKTPTNQMQSTIQQQKVQQNAETNASVGQVRATVSSAKQLMTALQEKLRKTRNAQATNIASRVNRKIDEVMRDLDELTKTFT